MNLTAAFFTAYTDNLTRQYLALKGTFASGYGAGDANAVLASDWGFSKASREGEAMILALQNRVVNQRLAGNAATNADRANAQTIAYSFLYPLILDLDSLALAEGLTGVTSLSTFATYYNTSVGGPYNALVHPDFATLYAIIYSGTVLDPLNVYSPAIANVAEQSFGGALAPGDDVDTALYAGLARSQIVVSGSTWGGAGEPVVVTGSARTALGTTVSARTFTSASVGADGTFALTPTVAGDLLLSVSAIALPADMTAGTIVVEGLIPAGRFDPPL